MRETCISHRTETRIEIHQHFWEHASNMAEMIVISVFFMDRNPKTIQEITNQALGTRAEKQIRSAVRSLGRDGYLESRTLDPEAIAEHLALKNLQGLGVGNKECEWCKIRTYSPHEHHFPIPRRDGGTKTVSVCGTCHADFHALIDVERWHPTEQLLAVFKTVEGTV